MLIKTERFGSIMADKAKIITFDDGLPGLLNDKHFMLVRDERSEPIEWLQSVDTVELALPVVRTFEIFPDYDIEIPNIELEGLHIANISDMLILNVVVIPETIDKMTANLLAPIVINIKNGAAKQIIIDTKKYSVKEPAFDALIAFMEGGES